MSKKNKSNKGKTVKGEYRTITETESVTKTEAITILSKRGKKPMDETTKQIRYDSYVERITLQNSKINEANKILPSDRQIKEIIILSKDSWMKTKPTGESKDEKNLRIAEKKEISKAKQEVKINKLQEKIDNIKNGMN